MEPHPYQCGLVQSTELKEYARGTGFRCLQIGNNPTQYLELSRLNVLTHVIVDLTYPRFMKRSVSGD